MSTATLREAFHGWIAVWEARSRFSGLQWIDSYPSRTGRPMATDQPPRSPQTRRPAPPAPSAVAVRDAPVSEDGAWGHVRTALPATVSLLVHTLVLLVLALVTLETTSTRVAQLIATPPPPEEEDPPVEIELDPELETVVENITLFDAAPPPASAASPASMPVLDQTLVAKADTSAISIQAPTVGLPDSVALIEAVPDGAVKGEAREIVDSYQQAMDRLTQELVWMLDQGPVLVTWCFDQSESMKDDQREIRDRIELVYEQLGLLGRTQNKALLTGVTSYGQQFIDHTMRDPTSDRDRIRKAIDSVPVDDSGKEVMCGAVATTINAYRELARRGRRQMAMILVTDESGDRQNNDAYLEETLRIAKGAKCRVYVLGRESVFGYPYAHIRWDHPQTNRTHWLQIDRGPETAFPEQLQTNGFRRRHDAFSSGFGSYEQCRLARETNGIFFMLPSVETNLVGAQKERYEMEALRPYRPDLRARMEVLADRNKFPLRTLIWQVIQDLNPHNKAAKKAIEMRMDFSLNPQQFVQQARTEQAKAKMHLQYMSEAEKRLIAGNLLREQEVDPRWQANYDLILAQLVAYQARIYEYGVALDDFIKAPKTAEPMRGNRRLVSWDIRTIKKVRTEEAKPYIDRARKLFTEVQRNHPGSPWSARAAWELRRGFGVDLYADYHAPYVNVKNPMKPPKL